MAVRKKLADMGLTLDEMKKIQDVLKQAEEHEKVERLRIGYAGEGEGEGGVRQCGGRGEMERERGE